MPRVFAVAVNIPGLERMYTLGSSYSRTSADQRSMAAFESEADISDGAVNRLFAVKSANAGFDRG